MAKLRELSEYCLFGDVDAKKARELHELVGELRGRFVEDSVVQDVLLNHGCELREDERPRSFYDIPWAVFNRKKTLAHLIFLEEMIDLATKPELLVVKSPLIVIPGQDQAGRIESHGGLDAIKTEWMQRQWFENPEAVASIREYRTTLSEAFDEYNMQLIVNLMRQCSKAFIDSDWKEEARLHKRIEKALTPEEYVALDSAYYNMGNRFFRYAGPIWEKLNGSLYGKFFILKPEEVQSFLRMS